MSRQFFNLFFPAVGALIMIRATWRFHKLVALVRDETYETIRLGTGVGRIFNALMYFFILGFFIGFTDALIRDVEPIYTFIVLIFFLGSIFIAFGIEMQISTMKGLRERKLEILKTLINAVELKDPYTKGHSEHVYHITSLLYEAMDEASKNKISISKLLDAALLHDCGKISVADNILNKPGSLTAENWQAIKSHPATAKKMLDDTYFREISDWVLYHHERMDGKGYYGLAAGEIPLESRIIAIADTYSALTTNRVYRRKLSSEKALETLKEIAGNQLDPNLVNAFLRIDRSKLENIQEVDN